MLYLSSAIRFENGVESTCQFAGASAEYLSLSEFGAGRKQVVSLVGFLSHLGSGSCQFLRFEKLQAARRQLTEVISGRRIIAGVF